MKADGEDANKTKDTVCLPSLFTMCDGCLTSGDVCIFGTTCQLCGGFLWRYVSSRRYLGVLLSLNHIQKAAQHIPPPLPQVSGLLALKKELAALIGAPADAKKKKGKH